MMIEMQGISKTYNMGAVPIRALSDVTLSIEKGEFVAVMGPSGSGKSTLLHVMGCIDRPTAGAYLFGGREVASLPDRALANIRNKEIGFVFQSFNLLWGESAVQNVMLPLVYDGSPGRKERARLALESVGLGNRLKHRPGELSGGEQQRVAIARALVKRPSLILADEPTGDLDSRAGAQIMELFRGLNEKGITVVVVTHEVPVAEFARRRLVFSDGRMVDDMRR